MFHDFTPGGSEGGITGWLSWFCFLVPTATFFFYGFLPQSSTRRRGFLAVGILLHICMMVVIIAVVSISGGGFVVMPLLLIGPVIWLRLVSGMDQPENAYPDGSSQ